MRAILVTAIVATTGCAAPTFADSRPQLPSSVGVFRLGASLNEVKRIVPLEEGTGGTCQEFVATSGDVIKSFPLDLSSDGLIMFLFDNFEADAQLSYVSLPISSDTARTMIDSYTEIFGPPEITPTGWFAWTQGGIRLELAYEVAKSPHSDRGYLSLYWAKFDPLCSSHH